MGYLLITILLAVGYLLWQIPKTIIDIITAKDKPNWFKIIAITYIVVLIILMLIFA